MSRASLARHWLKSGVMQEITKKTCWTYNVLVFYGGTPWGYEHQKFVHFIIYLTEMCDFFTMTAVGVCKKRNSAFAFVAYVKI